MQVLQQVLGQTGQPGSAGSTVSPSTMSLMQELVGQLKSATPAPASAATQAPTAPPSSAAPAQASNPAMGISGAEINAVLAYSNNQGPAVTFADYDFNPSTAPAAPAPSTAQGSGQSAGQTSGAMPAAGISGSEIDAMLAYANGQGPAVSLASFDPPPSAQSAAIAPTAGGQVSSLASQTQNQEA